MANIGPFGWDGGWNTKASAYTLPQNQMCDGQNVYVSYGDLKKVPGSKVINSSAISGTPAVHGVTDWQTAAGQRYLVVTAGTKIFQAADLTTTLTDITGALTITTGANNQSTFSSLNNLVVRCGGATPDAPIKWTGTGNAALLGGSPPSGSITCTANNFMFISGVAANPSRVYYSNVGDPETWGASNYVDFRPNDGDKVTALIASGQNLIIFKRRSIGILFTQTYSISGATTLAPLNPLSNSIGCPGPLCVDTLPGGRLCFLGTDNHFYIWNPGEAGEDVSDPIPPKSNIQPTFDALVAGRLQYTVVKVYPTKNQIWISCSSGSSTTNNQILVYDYKLECWMPPVTGRNANVMAAVFDTRTTPSHPIVLVTGNYGGNVYEHDTGTTNAEDANGTIDGYGTVSIVLGEANRDFIPESVVNRYEAQTLGSLEFNYNFDDYTNLKGTVSMAQIAAGGKMDLFILDSDVLGGATVIRKPIAVNSPGKTSTIQVQYRNRNGSETFVAHPFLISDEVIA